MHINENYFYLCAGDITTYYTRIKVKIKFLNKLTIFFRTDDRLKFGHVGCNSLFSNLIASLIRVFLYLINDSVFRVCENRGNELFVKKVVMVSDIDPNPQCIKKTCCVYVIKEHGERLPTSPLNPLKGTLVSDRL